MKQKIRLLILGELALQCGQIVWDIGAGAGSVSIEIARLCPSSTAYAIEKPAADTTLIQQNCQRFRVENVKPIHSHAPDALIDLLARNRILIGGSGGHLSAILDYCEKRLVSCRRIVFAIAIFERLTTVFNWLTAEARRESAWGYHLSANKPFSCCSYFVPYPAVTA